MRLFSSFSLLGSFTGRCFEESDPVGFAACSGVAEEWLFRGEGKDAGEWDLGFVPFEDEDAAWA